MLLGLELEFYSFYNLTVMVKGYRTLMEYLILFLWWKNVGPILHMGSLHTIRCCKLKKKHLNLLNQKYFILTYSKMTIRILIQRDIKHKLKITKIFKEIKPIIFYCDFNPKLS